MTSWLILVFGGIAYWSFLMAILYLVGFVGNIIVPRSIDVGPEASFGTAVAIDLLLIAVFAIQHSVMARPAFKKWWTTKVPDSMERSTYVLFSSSAFGLMFWFWRPIPDTVWHIDSLIGAYLLTGLFWLGWLTALTSTFLINHFDLFGLRQARLGAQGRRPEPIAFTTSGFYRHVRHPINLGFLIAIWAATHMTVGHLVFSVTMTAYILVATHFEEQDLMAIHGDEYREYKRKVPMLIPTGRRSLPSKQ